MTTQITWQTSKNVRFEISNLAAEGDQVMADVAREGKTTRCALIETGNGGICIRHPAGAVISIPEQHQQLIAALCRAAQGRLSWSMRDARRAAYDAACAAAGITVTYDNVTGIHYVQATPDACTAIVAAAFTAPAAAQTAPSDYPAGRVLSCGHMVYSARHVMTGSRGTCCPNCI